MAFLSFPPMSSVIKKLPKSEVALTITVPYDDYLEAQKEAIQKISQEIKMDGFRSGHIPEEMVRQQVGDAAIASYTLECLISPAYAAAAQEHHLQVVAQPKIEVKEPVQKEGDACVFVA